MTRARLVLIALLLAAILTPQRSSAANPSPGSGSPAGLIFTTIAWQPWDALWQWLTGSRIDGRSSDDVNGANQGTPPAAAQTQDGGRQIRPYSSPLRHPGMRILCGAIPDPMGGCTPNAPITRSRRGFA
jgi:hypothetical protein